MLLNLGSGQRPFKSPWLNIDVSAREKPDYICDIRDLSGIIPNEQADIVVLHHVLEHFHLGDNDSVIRESYRVLKPGGSLLIFVPDLRRLAQRWLTGQIDDYTYLVNLYGAWQGQEGDDHHWGFSSESLKDYLMKVNIEGLKVWKEIKPFDWRDMYGADLARDWWILAVECVK